MGITRQSAKLLFHANQEKKITESYLSIGKQTVNVHESDLIDMGKYYIGSSYSITKEADRLTRHSIGNIPEDVFIASINDKIQYNCIDISDYEGANILADLNQPIGSELKNNYDFIYDGSCIDNVFDPVVFIQNVSDMLRPGGRCLIAAHASTYPGAYLMFSPEWFFSFFAANNFRYCRVILASTKYNNNDWVTAKADFFEYSPYFTRDPNYDRFKASKIETTYIIYVLAEKGEISTSNIKPIQLQYADKKDSQLIHKKYDEYVKLYSNIDLQYSKVPPQPLLSDHFKYIGSF